MRRTSGRSRGVTGRLGGPQARRGLLPGPQRVEGWATGWTAPGGSGGEASHPREDGR